MKRFARYVLGRNKKVVAEIIPNPRVIVFDFDGTIADTFEAGYEILNKLAAEFNFRQLDREGLARARDMRTRELMKYLGISSRKMAGISRRGSEELSVRMGDVVPLPGVPEILRELHKRGFILGIITSNSHANVTSFLRKHDLDFFGFIRSSSKLLGKAREIRVAMKNLKIALTEILFVGDETRDIEATQKVGIPIAAVTWGYNSRKSIEALKPSRIFDRPEDLLEFLTEPAAPKK